MRVLNLLLAVSLITSSCVNDEGFLKGTFVGTFDDTTFEYQFYKNGSFVFTTDGHYGNSTTKGKYAVIDSNIMLCPDTDWDLHYGVLKSRLLLTKSGCIKDYDNNFYCNDYDETNSQSEKQLGISNNIINRLKQLDEVVKLQMDWNLGNYNDHGSYFQYNGIVRIENLEFHYYDLRTPVLDTLEKTHYVRNVQYHDYLINVENNSIYKYHSYKDSISFVSNLN